MVDFIRGVLSFPTIIFSFFMGVSFILWLLTALGLLGFEGGDVDTGDFGDAGDLGDSGEIGNGGMHSVSGKAGEAMGLMTRFGFNGVPITVVISLLSIFAWVISLLMQMYVLNYIHVAILYYLLGLVVMLIAFAVSVYLTGKICRPLRNSVFHTPEAASIRHLIGRTVTVRSATVNERFGVAMMEDGGAGMILQIRSDSPQSIKKGDKVVLLNYLDDIQAYKVISEDEFKGI